MSGECEICGSEYRIYEGQCLTCAAVGHPNADIQCVRCGKPASWVQHTHGEALAMPLCTSHGPDKLRGVERLVPIGDNCSETIIGTPFPGLEPAAAIAPPGFQWSLTLADGVGYRADSQELWYASEELSSRLTHRTDLFREGACPECLVRYRATEPEDRVDFAWGCDACDQAGTGPDEDHSIAPDGPPGMVQPVLVIQSSRLVPEECSSCGGSDSGPMTIAGPVRRCDACETRRLHSVVRQGRRAQ